MQKNRRANKASKRKREEGRKADRKLVEKANPGLGNKYAKEKLAAELKVARNTTAGNVDAVEDSILQRATGFSSSQFFAGLQRDQERKARGVSGAGGGAQQKKKKRKKTSGGASGGYML